MAIELPWTNFKTPKRPAFVMGTSPSILDEPLHLIDESAQIIYLCNHAWKALDMGLLYKCNGIVYTGLSSWVHQLDGLRKHDAIPKFYSDLVVNSREFKEQSSMYDRYYLYKKAMHNGNGLKDIKNGWLPSNIEDGIGNTGSVTLDMAMICYLLGYKKIYLIGMDLDYTALNPYFCESSSHNYKMSGPVVENGTRHSIHMSMCLMSQRLAEQGVELVNISRGYKPEQYNNSMTMPVDRLENILDGVVKPKAIGCIVKGTDPLNKHDIDQITFVRSKVDKLIISCPDADMQCVMNALRFVDGAIISNDEQHALEQLRQEYPKDSIRIFDDTEYVQYNPV